MRSAAIAATAVVAACFLTAGAALPVSHPISTFAALPIVRPPGIPWTLGNTAPHPPRLTWTGPPLLIADAPEDLTPGLFRDAAGGEAIPHVLYADRFPDIRSPVWVFAFVKNETSQPLEIGLTIRSTRAVPARLSFARGAAHAVGPGMSAAGEAAGAQLLGPGGLGWGPAQSLAANEAGTAAWPLPPGQVLTLWTPVRLTDRVGRALPVSVAVWEGPAGKIPATESGPPLPAGRNGSLRTTVPHAWGTWTVTAPTMGAVAYDFDNDAPTPSGKPGGRVCPPWVCLNGQVITWQDLPFSHAADPMPGEVEDGVDHVDAPGRLAAAAVVVHDRVLRTGNYGDYGCLLTFRLRAPAGRLLYAAAVPGFNRAIPWVGETRESGRSRYWALPSLPLPPGAGYLIAEGASRATIRTTVTAGAYAPWRIVIWSLPISNPTAHRRAGTQSQSVTPGGS